MEFCPSDTAADCVGLTARADAGSIATMGKQPAATLKSLVFGFALMAGMPAAVGAERGDVDTVVVFEDWLASCDNVLTCTVLVLPLMEGGSTKTNDLLRFERPAGPHGSVDSIIMSFGESSFSDMGVFEFRVDGKTILTVTHDDLVEVSVSPDALRGEAEAPVRTLYTDPTRIALLIDAMATGKTLTITSRHGIQQSVSLLGLERALRWIDERQGRVGTATALVARGNTQVSSVPDAPTLPVIRHAAGHARPLDDAEARRLTTIVREQLTRGEQPEECDGLNRKEDPDSSAAFAFAIDARLAIVAVRCCVSGAYNHVTALHGVDRMTADRRPILIERTEAMTANFDENPGVPIVVNVGFDQANLRLSHYSAGRGTGDCGSYAEWIWDGARFALTLHRAMPACRGADRGDWPIIYRARVD